MGDRDRSDSMPSRSLRGNRSICRHPSSPVALVFALCTSGPIAWILWSIVISGRDAVQIGQDEGFELAKALLMLQGKSLYLDVWNDQPPLHTWMVTWVLKHVSGSMLAPRVLTMLFSTWLACGLGWLAARREGWRVGGLAAGMLVFSPGYLELGCSCMLEIPALAAAMGALVTLTWATSSVDHRSELQSLAQERWLGSARRAGRVGVAGMVFGVAMQIKLTAMLFVPAGALTWWLIWRRGTRPWGDWLQGTLWFLGGLALSFSAVHLLIGDNSYFSQLWISHFSSGRSFEYGSAQDYPFRWVALVKNWDLSLPALMGCSLIGLRRYRESCLVPIVWLTATLGVMAVHRPWWSYYYVHLAIPMTWLAALALREGWRRVDFHRHPAVSWLFCVLVLGIGLWQGARAYWEVSDMRRLPQIHSSLVIAEMKKYRPYVTAMYSDQPVYSFHAGIPMLPHLAVLPLKRFWSGEMTNAKLEAELRIARPGLILLANDGRETPIEELVRSQYQMVYQDQNHRLYAVPEAATQVGRRQAGADPGHPWALPPALPVR
jgi:hypothetical protein